MAKQSKFAYFRARCSVLVLLLAAGLSPATVLGEEPVDPGRSPEGLWQALDTADLEFRLRGERAGTGDGRVYTATYTAVDGSDNPVEASGSVEVPLSQAP